MSQWPQISVLLWLSVTIATGLWSAIRVPRRHVVLGPRAQRIAALTLTASAICEASMLLAGGFFERLF